MRDFSCDSVWIRTKDRQLRRLMLYPAELRNPGFQGHKNTFLYLILLMPANYYFMGSSLLSRNYS